MTFNGFFKNRKDHLDNYLLESMTFRSKVIQKMCHTPAVTTHINTLAGLLFHLCLVYYALQKVCFTFNSLFCNSPSGLIFVTLVYYGKIKQMRESTSYKTT